MVLFNLFIPKTILYVDDNLSKMKIRQKLGRSISKFNNQNLENKIRSGFIAWGSRKGIIFSITL